MSAPVDCVGIWSCFRQKSQQRVNSAAATCRKQTDTPQRLINIPMVIRERWLALIALFASLLLVSPVAAETITFKVDIEAPDNLAAVLRDNLDIISWAGRDDVNEEQIRQLVKTAPDQARRLLETEGYFSAKAQARIDRQQAGWVVKLRIEPGEPTRIVSVDFSITGAIEGDPDREQRIASARAAFNLKEGAIFRQRDWTAGKEGATHSLHRKLYAAARVTNSRAEIDPNGLTANLTVEIDSGPPFTFGELEVNGLQRYPVSIVRNLSPIKPGDPYDEEQLLRFQKRLLVSGRFASAVAFADSDPQQANATPVTVNVVETQARTVEFGIGLSTDRGPRGLVGYTDQNTFDRAIQLDSRVQVDRLSQQAVAGLTLPRNEKGWRYGLEGGLKLQDIQNEERSNWNITGAHTFLIEEYQSQQSLQLLAENTRLADNTEDNVLALYLAQKWSWNKLNDLLAPREGSFVGLEVGGASEEIVSDASFGRVVGKVSYFLPVKTFGTVAARLEAGAVISDNRENIPSEYLFRTGGDTTVRGYEYQSLGILEGGAIVGGRYLLVGSIEYIQWFTQQWGAAVFYDVGNAVDKKSDFEAVAGYGVGARWYSPVGALNLDIAYGEEVDEYRIHFTAGFVFR